MARMMVWYYPDRVGLFEQDGETLTKIDERDAEIHTTCGFRMAKVPSDWGMVRVITIVPSDNQSSVFVSAESIPESVARIWPQVEAGVTYLRDK